MNKTQKKKLNELAGQLVDIREAIDAVMGELQDKYDEHSERWQESEKGEELNDKIDELNDLIDDAEALSDRLYDLAEE